MASKPPNIATQQDLDNQDWDNIYPDLLLHVNFKYDFLERSDQKDLLHDALAKVLEGTQPWDMDSDPDIRTHIKRVIRSTYGSKSQKAWPKKWKADVLDDDGAPVNPIESIADTSMAPDEELFHKERLDAIEEAAKSDSVAELVVMAFKDGCSKPSEIAEYLELPINEVNNALRRIRRRLGR